MVTFTYYRFYCSIILVLSLTVDAFNIDIHVPIYKFGPENSYFGYSVAQHFRGDQPVLLIGAPKGESGQTDTVNAGAIYSCPLTNVQSNSSARSDQWCQRENVEYSSPDKYNESPTSINGREFHFAGKNGQQLGAVIASSGEKDSRVLACAPLLRYHNSSAYTDGTCYVLDNDLKQTSVIHSCYSLSRIDRHNNFGACMEGFSAHVHQKPDMLATGLLGARKWTGGVFARLYPPDQFDIIRDRWTMDVDKSRDGVRAVLAAHDYLGFSVKVGKFGFWYEQGEENVTVVSGATRFGQTGAVIFMPFRKKFDNNNAMTELGLMEDHFMLKGTQLGSAFGYALEVLDLNADGFDDLLVGAPFQYVEDDDGVWGGSVFVYYSRGVRQGRDSNANVFFEPIQLRAKGAHSQFGLSITKLGDVDRDKSRLADFAVGAPFANDGRGTVFIFHGARQPEQFSAVPIQTIDADNLVGYPKSKPPLMTFGFSLSGGADLDANGYPDLLVGAIRSDVAILLRARPVINVQVRDLDTQKQLDKDDKASYCPADAQTCFEFRTELRVIESANVDSRNRLIDLGDNVFRCRLQVLSISAGVAPRAKLIKHVADADRTYEWDCGRGANLNPQIETHRAYVPTTNRDWLNPLKFKFSVEIRNNNTPMTVADGAPLTDLNRYPVLNKLGSSKEFTMIFNKKCGADNVCHSDLTMQFLLPDLSIDNGTYVKHVSEKASIDLVFKVRNNGEHAYESMLFVYYDSNELDVPELRKIKGSINIGTFDENIVSFALGNPLNENEELSFELSFKLARGKSDGIGKPLNFTAFVNSTSHETRPDDNVWSANVRVIKKAELELSGVSQPDVVRYGGSIAGESAMELEEDIGPLVLHRYTVTNHGPWSVSNVSVHIDWPVQVASVFAKGKWALYLMELPTITTPKLDGGVEIRRCTTELSNEKINPLDLKMNTIYALAPPQPVRYIRPKRSTGTREIARERRTRELRIKPQVIEEKSGAKILVVDVNCNEPRRTAKCHTFTCHFDYIEPNVASIIDIRARLWNSTFVEDYRDVEYVSVTSSGRLLTDPQHGIEEDQRNNFASVSTHAYPDLPQISETAPIPWWVIVVGIVAGLLILLLIVVALSMCGFFKRARREQPTLYTAEFRHAQEQWASSDA